MARQAFERDLASQLSAAEHWIRACLIADGSILSHSPLWTDDLVREVHHAFVDHPDYGADNFATKLKGQMSAASAPARQLMAEMLWALLLFPSKMKAKTKRQQVRDIWALSGEQLDDAAPVLSDTALAGIGSGGPGFNTNRPAEMTFLVELTRDLKKRGLDERQKIFSNYDCFCGLDGDGSTERKPAISPYASIFCLSRPRGTYVV